MWNWLKELIDPFFRRRNFEERLDQELESHIAAYTEDLIEHGLDAGEARRLASLQFGSRDTVKEECRQAVGLQWMDAIARDARHTLRNLKKNPSFSVTAILTLALCIGANTAIYSLIDAVLFRPLPYPDPQRLGLVETGYQTPEAAGAFTAQDGRVWEALRDTAGFLEPAAFSDFTSGANLASGERAIYVRPQRVSAGFFEVLRVTPFLGRGFRASEDVPGGSRAAILSHHLWESQFHGDPSVLGRKILLNGEPCTVVGVMPARLRTTIEADLWTPLRASTKGEGSDANYHIIARLRPGVSWVQAESQIRSLGATLLHPPERGSTWLTLAPLQGALSQEIHNPLLILWVSAFGLLLIGCVNIAGLLISRAPGRSREIATRMALGCGRAGVLRQLMVEGFVLALLGAGLGCLLGYWTIHLLGPFLRQDLNIWQGLQLDGRVLEFTLLISVLSSLVFGMIPARQVNRLDLRDALSETGDRTVAGSRSRWARRGLVVAQVAIGVVLLLGSGLLIRSLRRLTHSAPGFDPNDVLVAKASLRDARYASLQSTSSLFHRSLARIERIPGVESGAASLCLPYERWLNFPFFPPGSRNSLVTNLTYVTPGFFNVLRIPLRRGRFLAASDRSDTAPVVVVNQAFIDSYQPRFSLGSQISILGKVRSIVGIVGNQQTTPSFGNVNSPIGVQPAVFMPLAQTSDDFLRIVHVWFSPAWIVRTSLPASSLVGQMKQALQQTDPLLPFASFQRFDDLRARPLSSEQLQAWLLSGFAGLALLLATVGLYGLIATTVGERKREMGIRMALGASGARAVAELALPGIYSGLLGILLGLLLAVPTTFWLRHIIWGIDPSDPQALLLVVVLVTLVTTLASLIPAARVISISPARTLRSS